ncbi:MAG: hypothetical protein PVI91_07620 [Gammaproteobacteria bacterium]|jgi:hypothetical protein
MMRRRRKYTAATGSDTDALQTDVMRFMSILGLCLMAVFALVQSLPLHETALARPEPEVQRLQQKIVSQQQRARALETELDRLSAQLRSTQERENGAQRALASARVQLSLIGEQAQQARSDRDRVNAELERLRQQLAQVRNALAGIEQTARDRARSLQETQERLHEQRNKLDDIARRADALQAERPGPSSDAPPSPASETRGFTLRFASVEALERLVATKRVSLYAMSGKQAWRLRLSAGKPVFASAQPPGWFHEMAASTVPVDYTRTLDTSTGGSAPSPVVWGVQLPGATTQQIAALTRSAAGGSLVIGTDGRVRLEPE